MGIALVRVSAGSGTTRVWGTLPLPMSRCGLWGRGRDEWGGRAENDLIRGGAK